MGRALTHRSAALRGRVTMRQCMTTEEIDMAASPGFKVYTTANEYVAACKHIEDAAAIVALRGDGATIRYNHRHIVWREGNEEQPAAESYDFVYETVMSRI